jgi:hypothetical protein
MQIVLSGTPYKHRWMSFHKRIPARYEENLKKYVPTPEPATYWVSVTMPWKRRMYAINVDSFELLHPVYCFGFRFHVSTQA